MGKQFSLAEVRRVQLVIYMEMKGTQQTILFGRVSKGTNSNLHGEGNTERDIAVKLRCSKTAVSNANAKLTAYGTSGRPRKMMPREDRLVRRIISVRPITPARTFVCMYVRLTGTAILSSTVSRHLSKELGLKSQKPPRKPYLTPVMKKKILEFVRRHRHWTLAEWKKVMFSDEWPMQQFAPRHMHIR